MRHFKSRFIEFRSEDPDISGDARRVGTGAVRKPHLPGGETVGWAVPTQSDVFATKNRHLPQHRLST